MRRYSVSFVGAFAVLALGLISFILYRSKISHAAPRGLTPAGVQLGAAGPDATGPGMAMDPPAVVDGSKEPQLIPDVVAYRLWFVAVALLPGATAAEERRQRAQLMTAGLKGDDVGRAASALATFKTSYDYLVGAYNDSVAEASQMGETPDLQGFLSQRDALVRSTEDALASALSATGMAKLRAYVQGQKTYMKVAQGDQ